MKRFSFTLLASAILLSHAGAQSLMGRPQSSPTPSFSKPKSTATHIKRPNSQQNGNVAPQVETPVITAIYRGPGTFDQRLFDNAVAAATALEHGPSEVSHRTEGQNPVVPVVAPLAEPKAPDVDLPDADMKPVDSMDPSGVLPRVGGRSKSPVSNDASDQSP